MSTYCFNFFKVLDRASNPTVVENVNESIKDWLPKMTGESRDLLSTYFMFRNISTLNKSVGISDLSEDGLWCEI